MTRSRPIKAFPHLSSLVMTTQVRFFLPRDTLERSRHDLLPTYVSLPDSGVISTNRDFVPYPRQKQESEGSSSYRVH
jgi:hypothetical protein